ncbi:MAG: polyprenyl synthetase family protein [Planctomycetes bacterium]|nr:polyprenyl synthetase family protein [Planctomycetota bacterium]
MIMESGLELLGEVRAAISERLERMQSALGVKSDLLLPGKMLRTRLAGRLEAAGACQAEHETIVAACAATEMVHTASLCHDDVIDESSLRRHRPALWTVAGRSAAVLTGDLLLCEAMDLVLQIQGGLYVRPFLSKVRQVVEAEIRQELLHRGQTMDTQTYLRVAREKTGPLFAFVAEVCAGRDPAFRQALEQAGYLVGTAYQLVDDLIDVTGREDAAGKALGMDAARNKFTLPQADRDGVAATKNFVRILLTEAVETLHPFAAARAGLESFIRDDLGHAMAVQGVDIKKERVA